MKTARLQERATDPYGRGRASLRARLRLAQRESLRPPPHLTLSQWWMTHMRLSRETSASTGKQKPFKYQVGIMDALTDATIEEVVVKKSARVGFTKALDAAIGYYIHQDPSPQLVVQPRTEDAEDYSATEIDPMLRDIKVLAEINDDVVGRARRQKITKKVFRNGSSVTFTGANSPGGFRRITARCVWLDEVDGYPVAGAGKEGDQYKLAVKRSETFWNRRIGAGSTPTIKGYSRIASLFEHSDQRFFYVPCPHCGEHQVLEWGTRDSAHGFKWDKDASGAGIPDSVVYVCKATGCIIREESKEEMIEAGDWRATKPFTGRAGFHIWTAYSLFPNATWPKLVKEWLEACHNPVTKQTFVNTVLGLEFEDYADKPLNEELLAKNVETWPHEVPPGVAVITCGIDVQDDRVEIETVGWGRNEESWSLGYQVLPGDIEDERFWDKDVDAALKRIWRRSDQMGFEVMGTCVDSGGHHTQAVYNFCKKRIGRRVWATKGESARGGKRSPVWPTTIPLKKRKQQYRPVILGVNAAKDVVRYRLHLQKPKEMGIPTPGYMHFPNDRDLNYFFQLTAEKIVVKQEGGQRYRIWELKPGRANEGLDCRVLAYAALCGLLHAGLQLNRRAAEVAEAGKEKLLPPPPSQPETPPGAVAIKEPTITVENAKPSSLASKLPR